MMKWIQSMISGTGDISSKRVAGLLLIVAAIALVAVMVIRNTGNSYVESTIITFTITGASLLGVSNITQIWKLGNQKEPKMPDFTEDSQQPQ